MRVSVRVEKKECRGCSKSGAQNEKWWVSNAVLARAVEKNVCLVEKNEDESRRINRSSRINTALAAGDGRCRRSGEGEESDSGRS